MKSENARLPPDGRRQRHRSGTVLALLMISLFLAGTARAHPKNAHERALALFKESKERYESGDFAGAADLLKRAYALEPSPVLSFDMGRAYESAGAADKAIEAYRTYLKADPHAKDRGAVLHRIDVLQQQLREQKRLAEERDQAAARAQRAEQQRQSEKPRKAPPPVEQKGPGVIPWIVAGTGGACLVAGGVFGYLAKQRHDDASTATSARAADDAQHTAQAFATVANIGFIAGGLLAASGITWVLLAPKRGPSGDEISLTVVPSTVRLQGRF